MQRSGPRGQEHELCSGDSSPLVSSHLQREVRTMWEEIGDSRGVKGSGLRLQRAFACSESKEQKTLQDREPETWELTGKQTDQLRTWEGGCGTVQPAWRFTYLTLAHVQDGTENWPSPGAKSPAAPCPQGTLSPIHSSHPQKCSFCHKGQVESVGGGVESIRKSMNLGSSKSD